MTDDDARTRCAWATLADPRYRAYHDLEWGVPVRDERHLFELLVLEGAQAGLSWSTILYRREGYRRAFAGFDPAAVAAFGPDDADRLLADPGIGFAKTADQSRALLRALPRIAAAVGVPLLVGASRKSFLAPLLGDDASSEGARDDATLATTVWCFTNGAAAVRVHDVAGARRAVELLEVLERSTPEDRAA